MSIRPDRWIREMCRKHSMIEPYEERPGPRRRHLLRRLVVRIRHPHRRRVQDLHQRELDDRRSQADRPSVPWWTSRVPCCIIPPNSFALGRTIEYFRIPRNVMTICVGQVHLRALRDHHQRHALRARVGGARDARDQQHHAAAGSRSTPTRASPRCCSSRATRSCETSYRDRKGEVPGATRASRCRASEPGPGSARSGGGRLLFCARITSNRGGRALIKELGQGLGVTLQNLFKKPFTVQYPDEKLQMCPRFRGLHILTRHADGLERCVGCELCAVARPADAILRRSGRERSRAPELPRRALCAPVRDQHAPLHLLRNVRRGVSRRRHLSREEVRASPTIAVSPSSTPRTSCSSRPSRAGTFLSAERAGVPARNESVLIRDARRSAHLESCGTKPRKPRQAKSIESLLSARHDASRWESDTNAEPRRRAAPTKPKQQAARRCLTWR